MMESITARMDREKAEREKSALERAESASSRNFAFTFSTEDLLSRPLPPYPLHISLLLTLFYSPSSADLHRR